MYLFSMVNLILIPLNIEYIGLSFVEKTTATRYIKQILYIENKQI